MILRQKPDRTLKNQMGTDLSYLHLGFDPPARLSKNDAQRGNGMIIRPQNHHRSERSARLGYANNPLDRLGQYRDHPEKHAALWADPAKKLVVFEGDIPLLRQIEGGLSPFFDDGQVATLNPAHETAFLGMLETHPVFALNLPARPADTGQTDEGLTSIDLRTLAVQGLLPEDQLGLLAQAKSLLSWHKSHPFCAQCGGKTESASAGWKRQCTSCNAQHFPRTDPVSIMLLVKGDRCVLGRQARFVANSYSCLAGFIEPGETLEDAVRRELFEEAGIEAGKVRYLSCQPWPFPSSLMIGCLAEALTETLTIDHDELEDARWFSREEVQGMLTRTHPQGLICPPPFAIANSLMHAWAFEGETP
jgi:NAD+ diphosphatase